MRNHLEELLPGLVTVLGPAGVGEPGEEPGQAQAAELGEVAAGVQVDVEVGGQVDVDQEHQVEAPPDLEHHLHTCIVYVQSYKYLDTLYTLNNEHNQRSTYHVTNNKFLFLNHFK